jgi:hypothetical protein
MEHTCPIQISLLVVTFTSHISWVLRLKYSTKEFKLNTYTYYVVIIVIIAMQTSCYSTMSHTTLMLYYHSLNLLNIICTSIASDMILWRLECNDLPQRAFGSIESLFCGPFTRLGYVSHIIMHPKVQSLPFAGIPRGRALWWVAQGCTCAFHADTWRLIIGSVFHVLQALTFWLSAP